MKIMCSKEELIKGLNIVSKAVPTRTPYSSLDSILINATSDEILLSATDTEIGIETGVNGSVIEKGMVAINSKMLNDFIKSLPSDDIIIDSDNNLKTTISCANSKPRFDNIMGKGGDEFMHIPPMNREPDIEITQFSLRELISKTIFSVSENENNRVMTGELFDINGSRLRVISMDGHRISIRMIDLAHEVGERKVIIPSKALSEINKILSGSMEDKVSIYLSANSVIFTFDNTKVFSTLFHGEYFNVDQMLSQDYSTKVIANRQNLFNTIQRANLLVRESDKRPVIVNISDNKLDIAINSQIARFDEDIEIEKEGADLLIGFNPRFLIETLRAIDDENVDMYFDGKVSPLVIRDKEESYIYLILPVNIMNEVR